MKHDLFPPTINNLHFVKNEHIITPASFEDFTAVIENTGPLLCDTALLGEWSLHSKEHKVFTNCC